MSESTSLERYERLWFDLLKVAIGHAKELQGEIRTLCEELAKQRATPKETNDPLRLELLRAEVEAVKKKIAARHDYLAPLARYLMEHPESTCSMGRVESHRDGRYVSVKIHGPISPDQDKRLAENYTEGRGERLDEAIEDLMKKLERKEETP